VRLPLNFSESRKTATAASFPPPPAPASITSPSPPTRSSNPDFPVQGRRADAAGAGQLLRRPRRPAGLDDDTLSELQRFGLLFDRDEQGDFSHAYTDTFEDRFFFEIVQRRGGYQQFGAVNAAVRMAMQARLREQARIEDLLS
jgi:4-hydroxyphenylpyruvate dioxygenase